MKNFIIIILLLLATTLSAQTSIHITMNENGVPSVVTAFTGEVKVFAGTTAPTGWVICDGSPLDTTTENTLFAVIGYTYGGAGASFNLPDLRGRSIIGAGTGAGLTARTIGQSIGTEDVTLVQGNLPDVPITVEVKVSSTGGEVTGFLGTGGTAYAEELLGTAVLPEVSGDLGGSDTPFNIIQPSLVLNYIIAL